jgi:glycerol transport system permease protein
MSQIGFSLKPKRAFAWSGLVPVVYIIFLMIPLYWLLNTSFKTNQEILGAFTLWPKNFTWDNYLTIFTEPVWRAGYINSITYVVLNTLISLVVALPAAYAFSRYNFLGDKHLFFWLLTNRMAPSAVFVLPFFQLYSSVGLIDTHIAETAYIDGYSFPKFFVRIFMPLIKSGIGVAAFFCFMFSWVELLIARTLTITEAKPISAVLTRTVTGEGVDWGLIAAAGILTIVPGALVIYFVRNYIAKGFALGRV